VVARDAKLPKSKLEKSSLNRYLKEGVGGIVAEVGGNLLQFGGINR
jgi:hypothetical protein